MDLNLKTAELTLTTVKLTPKILKQLPRMEYEEFREIAARRGAWRDQIKSLTKRLAEAGSPDPTVAKMLDEEKAKPDPFIGWIHAEAFPHGSYTGPRLLIKRKDGTYVLYEAMESTVAGLTQIFVV